MAKYIDADTVVSMPFLDDSYSIEKHTVETDTIENLLDRFTKEGCPEEVDVIPSGIKMGSAKGLCNRQDTQRCTSGRIGKDGNSVMISRIKRRKKHENHNHRNRSHSRRPACKPYTIGRPNNGVLKNC